MEFPKFIEDEIKKSYLSYALSVIASRAIPDARDGLKPVQRRIIYVMHELKLFHNKSYKKSARVVGEVLGKYHPHGDIAIYDALVRMAQPFSLRYPLVDGQGNFGSIDGDPPAAMRYTEVRMSKIASELTKDIEMDTVKFRKNFDNSLEEPVVLPSAIPNLLINGTSGIAVGMASNIPPHNLNEIIDALIALIDGKGEEEVLSYINGPDFPTGGVILGKSDIEKYKRTGKAIIKVRAKVSIKDNKIIITEIPYQVSKAKILEEIAKAVQNKVIEGVSDLIDGSDKKGLYIEIKLKKHVNPEVVLNNLFKHTSLQVSYSIIQIALVDNKPKLLSVYDLLNIYLAHRKDVILRRTNYLLNKDKERKHIVDGLLKALNDIEKTIEIIKASSNRSEAIKSLQEHLNITDKQANAILDMKLSTLMAIEKEKLIKEKQELEKRIEWYNKIINNEEVLLNEIRKELLEIKKRYADNRRTEILDIYEEKQNEDFIHNKDVVIVLTKDGFIKRVDLQSFKQQHRRGKGIKISSKEVKNIVSCKNKDYLLFFSNKGRVYVKKAYEIEEAQRYAKGRYVAYYFKLQEGERIVEIISTRSFDDGYLVFLTKKGIIKKTHMKEFLNIRRNGIYAITLNKDDALIDVKKIKQGLLLVSCKNGNTILFDSKEIRPMGRQAHGVRAIKCDEAISVNNNQKPYILFITRKNYSKKVKITEFPLHHRGGKGVKSINLNNDELIAALAADDNDEVLVVTKEGNILRIPVKEIPLLSRYARGVMIARRGEEIEEVNIIKNIA